ncbi:MAG: NAD+ synthase [Nitrospira sp.]|nr:NAD+ synthase [Nitrospira sp.]MDH4370850.1 NAD+ synthase [Nitrospira sp.]MDH5497407.1 NAD+ synthase [Nitrospira sp.]
MRVLRIAMAQMNPTVGDLNGNVHRIVEWIGEARKSQADLIAFPELAITGYLPEDLLFKRQFVNDNLRALKEVVRACRGLVAVVGYVARSGQAQPKVLQLSSDARGRQPLYNAAALIANCRIVGNCHKGYVPRNGDERRYFRSGQQPPLLVINGLTIGVSIGEDLWCSEESVRAQVAAGAEVMINLNASPFQIGKSRSRERFLRTWARKNGVIAAVVNMIGGHDESVFDGNSLILDQSGQVIARGRAFKEELLMADVSLAAVRHRDGASGRTSRLPRKTVSTVERLLVKLPSTKGARVHIMSRVAEPLKEVEEIYQALVLAVKDYVRKNGFTRVVIGVSGGVDSALTAVIAADALGVTNVLGIFMPSPYTSHESEADARELVQNLGIQLNVIPIASTFESYRQLLAPAFGERSTDLTEENLQARIRGNLLMAMSNKMGHLVLTTGNKSELSVGYSTLYGDMAGGFAVIKDVSKTMVYELARFRNAQGPSPVIPIRTLDRPPTAELKPDQKDEDTLPPYRVLDPILQAYVEEDHSVDEIVAAGFDRATVARVVRMVDNSEFKRRQAPIGVKITPRAFGKDRLMPITNGYRSIEE